MDDGGAAGALIGIIAGLIGLGTGIVSGWCWCWWRLFTRAGKPGWAAIVPIYNFVVMLEMAGRPLWWLLLMMVPVANIVVAILVFIDLAKAFGKDAGFGIGLAFLGVIFLPILAFSDSPYQGPPVHA